MADEAPPAGKGMAASTLLALGRLFGDARFRPQEDAPAWLDAARQRYRPGPAVYAIPCDARRLPSYLPRLVSADTRASAFFVDEAECSKPESDLEWFRSALC